MYAHNLKPRGDFQPRKIIKPLVFNKDKYFAVQIRLMADDPQVQKDLRAIAEEFSVAELDGLEKDSI